MKVLPFLLALLLAWLAVVGGYHLLWYPHFLGAGGPVAVSLIFCFFCSPPAVSEALRFAVAVALLGPLGLVLSASLALWGRRQRRAGANRPGAPDPADHRDIWLAG